MNLSLLIKIYTKVFFLFSSIRCSFCEEIYFKNDQKKEINNHDMKSWQNKSHEILNDIIQTQLLDRDAINKHRNLLAYSKLGKLSTLSFIHISRTGGGSFNKLLVENKGIIGRDGQRHADCIVPRIAYGNNTLPLTSRFDFPHCEILSSIFPMPTVQVINLYTSRLMFLLPYV